MSARKTREPGPEGFTWRGIELLPVGERAWTSGSIELGDRTANWHLEQPAEGGAWHARLRIGSDRFAMWGSTAAGALAAAAGEAANVATFIVAMLPEGELPGLNEATELRRSRRPRRAKKARR